MVVFERGCNLLQIVPVGISGTILACSSVGGNNSICMNFQLIQNLVSTPAKDQNVNVKQKQFKKRDRLRSYLNFLLCTVEKFKFSDFLLDDKKATYLSS